MDDEPIHDAIARLELQIETLSGELERCRKISIAARFFIGGAALWLALALLWIVPFGPTAFVATLAAGLGGIVLLGSNATTWEQTEASLKAAQAARGDLIGRIELRVVGGQSRTLH
jgi:hypothetical protein